MYEDDPINYIYSEWCCPALENGVVQLLFDHSISHNCFYVFHIHTKSVDLAIKNTYIKYL